MFLEVLNRKPEFLKKAFELFGFKLQANDRRPINLVLREAYLDFFTASLQPNSVGPYNKRLLVE
jgi:hypothetical protein